MTLESIGDAVICTDRAQRITFMNPTAAGLTGWDATEAIGQPVETVFRIVDEMSGEPLPGPVGECLRTLAPVSATEGIQLVDRTGARIDIRDTVAPVKTEDANVIGTVVVFQDTTRERKLQRQIAHSAAHDSLTKLRNRVSFETDLAEACREVSEEGRTHCVCFIDLDAFKPVNDEAGHAAGDALLQDIGATIKAGVRGHDVTARLGGDEFGLLLRDCPAEQAAVIADKMIRSINDAEFEWEGRSFRVGASVGVREIPRQRDIVRSPQGCRPGLLRSQGARAQPRPYLRQRTADRRSGELSYSAIAAAGGPGARAIGLWRSSSSSGAAQSVMISISLKSST